MTSSPFAVVLTGPPGAGKSATARELASLSGAPLLDLDQMTNPLVDLVLQATGGAGYDDPQVAPLMRSARYECLLGVADDCLHSGVSVVLVAPFTQERRDATAWTSLAARLGEAGGEAHLAWLRITPDELGRRLQQRSAARDAAKLADLAAYIATLDLAPPTTPHVVLEASQTPTEQAQQLLNHLAGGY